MKNEREFTVYDYQDNLESGRELKVVRYISANEGLSPLLRDTIESFSEKEIVSRLNHFKELEQTAYEKVRNTVEEWVDVAKGVCLYNQALEYFKVHEVSHTNNTWVEKDRSTSYVIDEEISNKTYKMYIYIYKDTCWVNGEEIPKAYYVTWYFGVNPPVKDNYIDTEIKFIRRKKFADKESALKYVEGRKRAYEKYFKREQPKIMPPFNKAFEVHGVLLPGYEIMGEDGEV